MLREQQDIFSALAQGRHGQDDHGEPEIEILTESLATRLALEVAVRGRHDPDVDLALAHAADAPHLPLLDGPQQLALHRQIDIPDLVEEQEPAFGGLDQAGLRFLGIRERPALVAEQLGLHEGRRNGRTVDLDERLRNTGAGGVDSARQDAFAGARLAREQHGWCVRQGGDLAGPLEHGADGG